MLVPSSMLFAIGGHPISGHEPHDARLLIASFLS